MSYEEKGVWTTLFFMAGAYIAYLAIIVPQLLQTPPAHVNYILPLTFTAIPSAIIALLVRSALELFSPSDSSKADARDRDIKRFGEHASRWCVAGGAMLGLWGAVGHWDYFWIANVIWLGFVLWIVVGSVLMLVAYRRGL